jgi:hypothetical protein
MDDRGCRPTVREISGQVFVGIKCSGAPASGWPGPSSSSLSTPRRGGPSASFVSPLVAIPARLARIGLAARSLPTP